MLDRDRLHAATPAGAADDADAQGGVGGLTQQDEARLAELRHADVQAMRAAEKSLIAAGLDPADPWAMQDLDMGPAGATPPAQQPPVGHPSIPEFDPDVRGTGYVYIRLADHIAARIQARELTRGTRLPGERDLAMQYGVSVGTVRRVAAELRHRKVIVTLPAKGTYVL